MADYENSADKAEPRSAQPWLDKIGYYKEKFDKWEAQRRDLDKLYSKDGRADSADREYSIFWANLEVLKPATYARPPIPVVAPRFKDGNVMARTASDVLERSLITTFEQADIDGSMLEVRDEFLRYARGTSWSRLAEDENGSPTIEDDHITADDFAHDCARTWREVKWVAKRAWMTREAGIARFGDTFEDVPLKKKDENAKTYDKDDTAPVWEIWHKPSKKVIWVAEDFKTILDEKEAFLSLRGFFPCPRPAYGTCVPKSLRPVPEILQYKDQIEEINEYTARIAALSESVRMRGFYMAGVPETGEAVEKAVNTVDDRAMLIPISSIAGLGGQALKDAVAWWPITDVVAAIEALINFRRVLIEDVYQITGISDIVRGQSTGAQKTATEQQIKSQWGSIRIKERQKELERFARDKTRIMGEIIAENYDAETLSRMSQIMLPTAEQKQQAQMMAQQAQAAQQPLPDEIKDVLEKPTMDEVVQFLKDDRARSLMIEIETDSTIQPNEDEEKQRRLEFVTAIGGLVQQAVPIATQVPQIAPFLVEAIKFTAAGFRAGRPLEASIDKLGGMVEQLAKQPQQKGPSPEEIKAHAEQQKMQMDAQAKQQDAQREQQRFMAEQAAKAQERQWAAEDRELDRQAKAAELQMAYEFDVQRMARQDEFEQKKFERDMQALNAKTAATVAAAEAQAKAAKEKPKPEAA
jgi:hypothetical protein